MTAEILFSILAQKYRFDNINFEEFLQILHTISQVKNLQSSILKSNVKALLREGFFPAVFTIWQKLWYNKANQKREVKPMLKVILIGAGNRGQTYTEYMCDGRFQVVAVAEPVRERRELEADL